MARTLIQIREQIEKLEKEAERVQANEVAGVIQRIKTAIDFYGLTADDLFGSGAKAATKSKKVAAKKAPAKKRTVNAAFMKALTPSAALAAVVGHNPLPRTEVVSKLWAYIKKNKLQDAVNKRMINADAKLKEVFNKAQVSMFEMAGLIGKHLK